MRFRTVTATRFAGRARRRGASDVDPAADVDRARSGERRAERERNGRVTRGVRARAYARRSRHAEQRPRRAGPVRLAGDGRSARVVQDDLSAERVLAGRERGAHQDGGRVIGRGAGDVGRRRVARFEPVRRAARIALVPGRPLEAPQPAGASRPPLPARAARAGLLRLARPDDLLDRLLRGVPERRRPEQRDEERGGRESDSEARQCALKVAPRLAVSYYAIANVTETVARMSCVPGSIGASDDLARRRSVA